MFRNLIYLKKIANQYTQIDVWFFIPITHIQGFLAFDMLHDLFVLLAKAVFSTRR